MLSVLQRPSRSLSYEFDTSLRITGLLSGGSWFHSSRYCSSLPAAEDVAFSLSSIIVHPFVVSSTTSARFCVFLSHILAISSGVPGGTSVCPPKPTSKYIASASLSILYLYFFHIVVSSGDMWGGYPPHVGINLSPKVVGMAVMVLRYPLSFC